MADKQEIFEFTGLKETLPISKASVVTAMPVGLIVKLGMIALMTRDGTDSTTKTSADDRERAVRELPKLLEDPEVIDWIANMQRVELLPKA